MSRFAWRRLTGPEEQRFSEPGPLEQRFPEGAAGYTEWRTFIGQLLDLIGRFNPDSPETFSRLHELFDGYIGALDTVQSQVVECCVFVSHKRCDVAIAERIAWVAVANGFDYWLDVHDPILPRIASGDIPSPFKETIIAAIVEMALLNATHLVAVHTPQSHNSLWVPYEIGRAKSRDIWSAQVSGWFQPGKVAPIAGEYTWLMERLGSRAEIERWLRAQCVDRPGCCTRPRPNWNGDEPDKYRLPDE
jgi:hypothetical protein